MFRFILVALLSIITGASKTATSENLLFQKTTMDLGIIKNGTEEVTAIFEIMNKTGKPVTINKVHASCGCMDVSYPKHTIKKKGTGKVKITIDVKRQTGYFKKSVLVYATNIRPTILRITGNKL